MSTTTGPSLSGGPKMLFFACVLTQNKTSMLSNAYRAINNIIIGLLRLNRYKHAKITHNFIPWLADLCAQRGNVKQK